MTDTAAVASTVPAHAQLIQMCAGGWVAAAVHGAAKLGLAGHLANGPRTAREYEGLLEKAAFRLQRIVPTTSVVSIIEAVPA